MSRTPAPPESLIIPLTETKPAESLELYVDKGRTRLWLTVREGRRFILKGLSEEMMNLPQEIARLRKEYSLGLRLNHPGVAGTYGFEVGEQTGPVIFMEFVDGIPLHHFLRGKIDENAEEGEQKRYSDIAKSRNDSKKRIPVTERLRIASKLAETLAYIHSMGVSHRDLKHDNIMITRSSHDVKIIDLGFGDSEDYVAYKTSLGTEEFGAPEQQTPTMADGKADIYSFGKILEDLLPERRFGRIRARCLRTNPTERPGFEEICVEISKLQNRKERRIKEFLLLLIIVLTAAVISLLYLLSQNRTSTDLSPIATPDSEQTSESAITDSASTESEEPYSRHGSNHETHTSIPDVTTDKTPKSETHDASDFRPGNTPTRENISSITKKYYDKFEQIIRKYGNTTVLPFEEAMVQTSSRQKELDTIIDAMTNELEAAGCPKNEIIREKEALWFYGVTIMNEVFTPK